MLESRCSLILVFLWSWFFIYKLQLTFEDGQLVWTIQWSAWWAWPPRSLEFLSPWVWIDLSLWLLNMLIPLKSLRYKFVCHIFPISKSHLLISDNYGWKRYLKMISRATYSLVNSVYSSLLCCKLCKVHETRYEKTMMINLHLDLMAAKLSLIQLLKLWRLYAQGKATAINF